VPNEEDKSGEQKAAEADVDSFRKDLGPFVVAAETTRMAMVFTNAKEPGNPIIFANDSFLELTKYNRDEVLGQNFNFFLAQGADPDALAAIAAELESSSGNDPQIRYRRKDGSVFWAMVLINPVRDEAGDIVQHFASFMDITRHKDEEDRLQFLLDELNHRTQNTLATVMGISTQTLHGVADQEVVNAFEGRILALSKAQSLLGRTNWEDVSLHDVLDQILGPFGLNARRASRFSVAGDDVRLRPKTALTLAMVFHELATNALKHGALSTDAAGQIEISWRLEPAPQGQRMRLRWQESGGPLATPPTRKGFGARLIERGLAQELDGEVRLDYDPTGVVCQIVMPLPGGTVE
jgi:PAS domain S-box-containing protein